MKMKFISEYRIVAAVLLPLLVLAAARSLTGDHFRNGAERNALTALNGTNLVSPAALKDDMPEALLIILDGNAESESLIDRRTISLKPGEIADKQVIKTIKRENGPVILVSGDRSLVAASWMILAQKGVRNLYILTDSNDWGQFKYEFRPSATVVASEPE